MSAGLEWSSAARADLREIWYYIAVTNYNRAAADRLRRDIQNACKELALKPSLGHARRDLTRNPEILFYRVREHYLVIYRRNTRPLQIARILHGSRDVKSELQADGED